MNSKYLAKSNGFILLLNTFLKFYIDLKEMHTHTQHNMLEEVCNFFHLIWFNAAIIGSVIVIHQININHMLISVS